MTQSDARRSRSLSTSQPVDTHTVVDKRRLTRAAVDASESQSNDVISKERAQLVITSHETVLSHSRGATATDNDSFICVRQIVLSRGSLSGASPNNGAIGPHEGAEPGPLSPCSPISNRER
jgi:hypothetical protein